MDPNTRVYLQRKGRPEGPYSLSVLLQMVEDGDVSYEDWCVSEGQTRPRRVREVLDWDDLSDTYPEIGEEDEDEDEWDEGEEESDGEEPGEEDDLEEGEPEVSPPRRYRHRERILYRGRPSLLSYPKSLILTLACIVAGVGFREQSEWYLIGGLGAGLLVFSGLLTARSLRLYLVSAKRVELVTGFLAHDSREVLISDIKAINVKQPGLKGLFGVGTVEFDSPGGDGVEVSFTDVGAAHQVKKLVRQLQDGPVGG